MVKKHNKATKPKSKIIEPSSRLIKYLEETLDIEEHKSKPKKQKQKGLARKIRSNDEKKVRTMDYLFRSMADLIYFFEFINKNPALIKKFDNDLEELLGLKIDNPQQSLFSTFIEAIVASEESFQGQDYGKPDFAYRYRVLGIMQRLILKKAMPVYSEPYLAAKEPYPTEYTNKEDRQAIYDKFLFLQQIVDKLDKYWVSFKLDNLNFFPKRSIVPYSFI